MALFLGLEIDADLADWARATVNAFVRDDSEGRLSVPEPTGGLHLTRPCLPVSASVAALRPDVVVALDAKAAGVTDAWLDGDRSAIVIQLSEDTSDQVELVSWQVGRARGRLRARVGRGVTPTVLAALTRRLCAGPQPLPPVERSGRPGGLTVRRSGLRRNQSAVPSVRVLLGSSSAAARERFAGLAEQASATGVADVTIAPLSADGGEVGVADVVVLHGASGHPAARRLIDGRRRRGLPTVLDLAGPDVEVDGTGSVALTDQAGDLARTAGLAIAPGARACASARRAGARALVVATMIGPERVQALLDLGDQEAVPELRLGWYVGRYSETSTGTDGAVAVAVASWLEAHAGLEIDVVGRIGPVLGELEGHPRVQVLSGTPNTRLVRRWTAQLWTGSSAHAEIDGDLQAVIEAHLLGVPTLLPADHPAVDDGLVPLGLSVAEPEMASGWRAVDRLLADPATRGEQSAQVRRLSGALYGPDAAASLLRRFLGWLSFGDRP